LVSFALKRTTPKKISHLLSKLAPPHTTAVKACLYSSIPIKGIPLLMFRNDPDEPMIENSSGTVKSGFWNPVYQNNCGAAQIWVSFRMQAPQRF
jgi:hypothetical protein